MELTSDENLFFTNLFLKFKNNNLNKPITISKLKNNTIAVNYNSYVLGKITLQSKTKSIMIHTDLYNHEIIEGDIENLILEIDKWIKYAKKYLK